MPAVILILALMPDLGQDALTALAILSTLAGNLLLTGSLCNIIVAERAEASGVSLSFLEYARTGVPLTLASLLFACAMLLAFGLLRL